MEADDDLAQRVEALEGALRALRQEQAAQNQRVVDALLEHRQAGEEARAFVVTSLEQTWQIIQDTNTFAGKQQQEIARLRADLAELAGQQATTAQLNDLYELRKQDQPQLELHAFLKAIGAGPRYRAVVTARKRQRQKNGHADQTDESG
jgi:DNA repair protein RadC